jgi:hypothetical protein
MNNNKHYVFYSRPHIDRQKRQWCGPGLFMRWDCVRFFIEEQEGLHSNMKRTTAVIVGRYREEPDSWFDDMDMITPQRILHIQVVPYWTQYDYDGIHTRRAPQRGPVFVPDPVKNVLEC